MLPQGVDGRHVQVGGGLVQQIDRRVHRIDRSKGDLLLFAAGQGKDAAAQQILDAQRLRRLRHAVGHLRLGYGLVLQAEGDLAVGVHVEELGAGVLEHAAHPLRDAVQGQAGHVLAVQQHPARQLTGEKLGDQAVDQPGQGGLAAAAAAAQQHALAVRDGQRHVPQAAVGAVGIGKRHMLQFDHAATAFHTISVARKAAISPMASQSAGVIRMAARQVRGLGFSMPRVTEAMLSSSAALLAAVSSGT